jgi:signal transduction histidine kinase
VGATESPQAESLERQSLPTQGWYWLDNGKHNVSQVILQHFPHDFVPLGTETRLGFHPGYVWLMVKILPGSDRLPHDWVLQLQKHQIDQVEAYRLSDPLPAKPADQLRLERLEGHFLKRQFAVPMNGGEPTYVLLKLASTTMIDLGYRVIPARRSQFSQIWSQILEAIFAGILIALAIYNLALYGFLRDPAYLLYVGFTLGSGLGMLIYLGWAGVLLPAWLPPAGMLLHTLKLLGISFGVEFTRQFLTALPIRQPRLDQFLHIIVWLPLPLIVILLATGLPQVILLSDGLLIVAYGTCFWAAFKLAKVGDRAALYLALTWVVVLVPFVLEVIRMEGGIPLPEWTLLLLLGACTLEAVLFSIGLTVRLADRRQAVLNELRSLNSNLEKRVTDRTRHLEVANQQLQRQQEALIRSARLAALGQFAGGMAHEISNPLAVILGAARQLQRKGRHDSFVTDRCQKVLFHARRIDQIIKRLREFSSPSPSLACQESTRLYDVIDQTCQELRAKIKRYEVHLDCRQVNQGIVVFGRADRLCLAMSSLIDNAIRAVAETPPRWVRIQTICESSQVTVVISDSGGGVEASDRQRIFEPFYTSRENATGLGLSAAWGIITSYRGSLSLRRERPTSFMVTLPLATQVERVEPALAPQSLTVNSGSILQVHYQPD